ncbi:MAG: BACON domain-containing protein [Bryobacteraceae bacterium]
MKLRRTYSLYLLALAALAAQTSYAQSIALTPSPASLTFTYQAGDSKLPAVQNISVRASTGTPVFTTSVPGGSLWLTVSPDSGKLPGSVAVRVNPTGLGVGTFTDSVVVAATGAAALTIPVTLNVTQPPPSLTLSATALTFTTPPNPPTAQAVVLTTTGRPIAFTATVAGATWLTVTPTSGVVLPGEQFLLTANVDSSSLNPQAAAYAGRITLVASGVSAASKQQNITVSPTVNAVQPTVTTLWPSSAQVNSPATTITLRGTNFFSGTTIQAKPASATTATNLSATFISPTAMIAVIPATLLTAAGTLNVTATNPAPGGSSAPSVFTISSTPVVQAIVNVASYAPGSVSPGELATLFGAGIGPVTPGAMQVTSGGFVALSVNSTSVTIDGKPSPIIYVSQDQISVQVPYEVTQGTGRAVVVTSGAATATGTVDVVPDMPGLFTTASSGTGQAAAFTVLASNGQMALNSAANPAHPGDAVVLYLTGEGDYATSLTPRTGLVVTTSISPLPQLNPLPTVTIGGAAATVTYAGPVVGSIMGLLQVNATVPAGSTTGATVPVVVTINGDSTQANVTLAIHP